MRTVCIFGFSILVLLLIGCSTPGKIASGTQLADKDVFFDAASLRKDLGSQTYFEDEAGATQLTPDSAQAIKRAGLDKVTKITILPSDASHAAPQTTGEMTFPSGYRPKPGTDQARFLILIAADGTVKGLYCYQYGDRRFALAAAECLIKWRYAPATIQRQPVQVLTGLDIGPKS